MKLMLIMLLMATPLMATPKPVYVEKSLKVVKKDHRTTVRVYKKGVKQDRFVIDLGVDAGVYYVEVKDAGLYYYTEEGK